MKTKKPEYNIRLRLGETYLSPPQIVRFHRYALRKFAAYVDIELVLTTSTYIGLREALINNERELLRVDLEFYRYVDDYRPDLLFTKTFEIVKIDGPKERLDTPDTPDVKLRLVDPNIIDLQYTSYLFKLFENKTAYEVVQECLNTLSQKLHYSTVFTYTSDRSTYIYEQIVLRSKNNLMALRELLDVYKPTLSKPFIFIDTFYSEDKLTCDGALFFFTLAQLTQFPQVSVTDKNVLYTSTLTKTIPFTELTNVNTTDLLRKHNTKITIRTPDMTWHNVAKYRTPDNVELTINAPDSIQIAKQRISQYFKVLDTIRAFNLWDIKYCPFDLFQLCTAIDIAGEFTQLVTGIQNIFHRSSDSPARNVIPYIHNIKVITAEYNI